MKSVLYIIRQSPGALADETTDLMLVSGVFEQPTSVLFLDEGVWQLVGLDERQSSVKALPTYDVEALHVAVASLESRGLRVEDIALPVRPADSAAVRRIIAAHDVVVTD